MASSDVTFPMFPPHMKATVFAMDPFDPEEDGESLRKALKGLGSDENAIIDVVAHRTNLQRQEIATEYENIYGKNLVNKIRTELSGQFQHAVVAAMTPLPRFYATELHDAMAGLGTTESTLIEVLCTLNNAWVLEIGAAYTALYKTTLEEDIRKDTKGTFERLLVALCQGKRDEGSDVDSAKAEADAQALFDGGEGQMGTDESTFVSVLTARSFPHLRHVFKHYEKLSGSSFEKAVQSEFNGHSEDAILAIVGAARDTPLFLAKCLHLSLAGAGTEERALTRLVVTRAESDLEDVKTAFKAEYGRSLEDAVESDASGDYKDLLLALIG